LAAEATLMCKTVDRAPVAAEPAAVTSAANRK
jgi:hypothetical protein